MGVFSMSLINQMLQELDARRSEVTGNDLFGQQIRAVPERRGVHPAWWLALVLGLVLCGVLVWLILRPPVSASVAGGQLPLRLDPGMNAVATPPMVAQKKIEATHLSTLVAIPSENLPPAASNPQPTVQVVAAPAETEKPSQPAKPALPERAVKTVLAPEIANTVPSPRTVRNDAPLKAAETSTPVVIHKQMKDLTPQQRAENDYRRALLALQQGRTSEAIDGLEQALQLDGQHGAARQALIGILLDAKRQDEAVRRTREGLDLNPAQPNLAMILARLQIGRGELRPAIDTLERTLPHAADSADYQAFLAALLQRDERHKQAAEHYLLALQRAPQNGVWWMGLGISYQADQRVAEAQEAFKRAKATNALSPELLAFVDARLGQLQR
jgi:MSHA biogenesis protein MshN